jgi:hypothetical protein
LNHKPRDPNPFLNPLLSHFRFLKLNSRYKTLIHKPNTKP